MCAWNVLVLIFCQDLLFPPVATHGRSLSTLVPVIASRFSHIFPKHTADNDDLGNA